VRVRGNVSAVNARVARLRQLPQDAEVMVPAAPAVAAQVDGLGARHEARPGTVEPDRPDGPRHRELPRLEL
jgi:hypothetical protein